MVPIVFGWRRFGRCDAISDSGHVATLFFHFFYFPVLPLKSMWVVGEGNYAIVHEIPMQWKSVFIAWARAVLCTFGLIGWGFALAAIVENHPNEGPPILAVAIAVLFHSLFTTSWFVPGIRFAGYRRAIRIFNQIGWAESGVDASFGYLLPDGTRDPFAPAPIDEK
jgi:hypothetical protein